ncbi:MAG TPA: amidase family protein [Opitutaceae bacterium]
MPSPCPPHARVRPVRFARASLDARLRRASRALLVALTAFSAAALALLPATSRAATFELTSATIADINAAFEAGALTSEKLTQLYLARIAAYDQAGPKLNAVIHLNEKALAEARALDAERKVRGPRSPLHGIPILVKDNYDTADMPTTGGAIGFKDAVPAYDAFMVKKLRAAGAILIAKTNMDEMARGGNGVSSLGGMTLNPHALDKIPGGSSAGTGAGVAAVYAPAGLGTETGGSVRHPSNDCNIVGMVATEGVLSRAGIMPISFSQDRGGPMALSVYDCAVLLTVMAGVDANDQITRLSIGKTPTAPYESVLQPGSLTGKRLGVLRDLFKTGPEHAESNQLIEDAIAAMKKAGAVVIDPVSSGTNLFAMTQGQSLGDGEYKWAINAYYAARGPNQPFYTLKDLIASGQFHERLRERYVQSEAVPPMEQNADYAAKYRNRAILKKLLEDLLVRYDLDAFVYPVRSGPLPAAGTWPLPPGISGQSVSDYCGLPAITVPAGFFQDGTPQGIEFMAAAFEDAKLLQVAYGYEQISHHRRLPTTTPALPGERFDY